MRTLGDRIKTLLTQAGHNQAELARHLDISPSAVGHYIHGRRVPPVKQLKKMAAFLGVTVAEIIEDSALITETEEERKALEVLRALPPEQRAAYLALLESLAPPARKE